MDLERERRLLLAVCRIRGVKWELVAREGQRRMSVEPLLAGDITEVSKQAQQTAEALREGAKYLDKWIAEADEERERARQAGARLLTVLDDDYPTNLRLVFNLPPFLFMLGELAAHDVCSVAVVGTRNPSSAGVELAAEMARGLAEDGVTVVSGLARGIDTAAHRAALAASGRTIAVLGNGILRTYPKENTALAQEIAESGALVSQFWPSAPPASYNFPRRNVVTSGISQGTVVIEATKTSGAKMQARLAVDHGKSVFLVRSLVTSEEWAQRYLRTRPRVYEVDRVEDVTARLRPPDQIGRLTEQRRQLALNLS